MLAIARRELPQATFIEADLHTIPLTDGRFDLVVCALALGHVRDLGSAIGELARVVRPGGRVIISVLHPIQAQLGWQAPFEDRDGQRGFVREHPHAHADYFAALTSAQLTVRGLVEPRLGPNQVRAKRRLHRHIPDAALAAYNDLPGALVWDAEKPSIRTV